MLRLKERSYSWALKHIEKYGDTDIFPLPFEFEAIRTYWDSDIKPELSQMNVLDWDFVRIVDYLHPNIDMVSVFPPN
ncbi:hypothetical protein M3650_26135 [Paenibacillus sp. MER TA 81-3]|uniref:hypothetical protein n=1 Tax=Paenibacillus sp. MER TA 81-3 TaxID=2939573 RepID=UPI0020410CF3|nr:hypothetical protein [Paenibacillus sp. MER TA 81-3]MCM3342009.1 hypothetical protein [Paenibacillus sp. MER TA 81-3]